MVNLVRRDLILQKSQLLIFIPFILLFVLTNLPPILTILVASIFIPFNALGYDEKVESHILLNSLPYTRKEIIASRYIGAVIYMVLSIGIVSFLLFIFNKPFSFTHIVVGSGLFLTFVAITFPLYHIFKPGNITIFILIGFLLFTWLAGPIVGFISRTFPAFVQFVTNLSVSTLYIVSTVIVLFLFVTSWFITMSIYERKAF